MTKKKGKGKMPVDTQELRKDALDFLKDHEDRQYNYKQLAKQLGLTDDHEREALLEVMQDLNEEGYLEEEKRGSFRHVPESQFIEGVVDMTKSGSAFIVSEETEDDTFVQQKLLNTALHGDQVRVLLYARRRNKKPEGEVVEVLKRHKEEFVGTLEVQEKFAFLVPDSRRMPVDIFIPMRNLGEGKNGDKAIVKITEYSAHSKNPVGKVVTILGAAGLHSTEMNAIIAEFDLPTTFPENVVQDAAKIPGEITAKDVSARRDLRPITTFTIDPDDAKDFDDALSIRKLESGRWEIGVHIADVTHYVKPVTALDKEAFERATSVYLVDRVIPMLPERLSNELCSLRPNEDKLTFSVLVEMDEDGNVKKEWFGKTIIHSDKRFSYEDAQERLETGKGEFAEELLTLNQLAYKLRERKFEGGALSFETAEVKFRLDENGKPLEVIPKVRKDAHKLIEDFMLLANRKVAEFIFKKDQKTSNRPFVYRHHDFPPDDKLKSFAKVAARFGHKIDTKNQKALSRSFNQLLEKVEGRPEQNMLQSLAIRSMSKAFYTTEKSSHYGLAFDYYTHFTSPIRRFPDMIAHRLLEHYLLNSKLEIRQEEIEEQCKHSSEMEVRAAEAERASIKYKQVEYMSERIGEEFDGIISGVTEWGIYVEMKPSACEGMIRLSELSDDYYSLDEESYRIVGNNTGKFYQLGDPLKVIVVNTNLQERNIDLQIAGENPSKRTERPNRRERKGKRK
ncbi:MAG: ribonuclease R [Bacteroidia bacterium]